MTLALKLLLAFGTAAYLAAVPALGYLFASHNPKCPCHSAAFFK